MEPVAPNMVLRRQLVRDCIRKRMFRQSTMERSIKCRNHGHRGDQNRLRGTDATDASRIVQRCDLAKRVEGIHHLRIDANGVGEPVAAVNDPVSYRIEGSKLRM